VNNNTKESRTKVFPSTGKNTKRNAKLTNGFSMIMIIMLSSVALRNVQYYENVPQEEWPPLPLSPPLLCTPENITGTNIHKH